MAWAKAILDDDIGYAGAIPIIVAACKILWELDTLDHTDAALKLVQTWRGRLKA